MLFLHLNNYKAFEKVLPSKIFEYAATNKPILAGVSGYSRRFINKEIPNAQTFNPCDLEGAIMALSRLKLNYVKRDKFIRQYNRNAISLSFAKEIKNMLINA